MSVDERCGEIEQVIRNRRSEATRAGMTRSEARRFAESDVDIAELRRLVKGKCPPRLIARILRPL